MNADKRRSLPAGRQETQMVARFLRKSALDPREFALNIKMANIFQNILKGKVVIIGIGNTMKGDDGCGPVLIERLRGKVKAVCIDGGSAPENYTGAIIKENPATILLVDATHLGLSPGQYEILKPQDILKSGFTTHDISPKMFIEYLANQTRADIYMLGIQPKNIFLGDEMSNSVKKTLDEIESLIKELNHA